MKFRWIMCFIILLFSINLFSQRIDIDKVWNEGVAFIQKGDYLQGLERMNEILEAVPENSAALNNSSICKRFLGDIDGSCQDITRIRSMYPLLKLKYSGFNCNEEITMGWLKKQFYKNTKIYPELGYRPRYTLSDTLRGALRPERDCYDVYYYNLTVRILPFKKSIRGTNEIWFKGLQECKTIQVDLFDNLAVDKITLGDKQLKYHRKFNTIFIEMPGLIVPGDDYKLIIDYSGKPRVAPRPPWDGGFVWSRDKTFSRWVGVTCQQLGASAWWPNKDHLSEKPDSMSINIEVPKKYDAISNGTLRKVVPVDNGYARYEWFVNYPVNNYNVTFYMGIYDEFTDTLHYADSDLIMRYHVLPYHYEKAKEHFKQARDVVSFYNQAFGPFPFWKDNYRMVESPYEGMEHQTAIAYGNSFDNKKNSQEYVNNIFDYIIVHETAHEWWGNAITAGDMADIWMHEGFATYSELMFIEHMLGYEASVEELRNQLHYIFNVWPLVQNRNVNENAFASNDVYRKGAALLHCLRATINNDSLFQKMLHDFSMDFMFKVVQSSDFIKYVNKYTGTDYNPFFNKYIYDTRIPVLSYKYERNGPDLILKYKWEEVEDGFFMPFSIETFKDNKAIRLVGTKNEQQVILKNTESFVFFQLMKPVSNCPHNGFTYYWTRCGNM